MRKLSRHLERHEISNAVFAFMVGFTGIALLMLLVIALVTFSELDANSALPLDERPVERAFQPAVNTPPAKALPRPTEHRPHQASEGQPADKKQAGAKLEASIFPSEADKDEPGERWPVCERPEDGKQSDLCAQWESAHQGFVANALGRSQLLLTAISVGVSLFVGVLAALGVILAAHASDLAAKAIKQGRDFDRGRIAAKIARGSRQRYTLGLENIGKSVVRLESVELASPEGVSLLNNNEIRHLAEDASFQMSFDPAGIERLQVDLRYTDAVERTHKAVGVFEARGSSFICTDWREKRVEAPAK